MKFELQLARGLMALALITGVGGLAAFAPPAPNATDPALACPSPATDEPGDALDGVASLMGPAWRSHLPALIVRRHA